MSYCTRDRLRSYKKSEREKRCISIINESCIFVDIAASHMPIIEPDDNSQKYLNDAVLNELRANMIIKIAEEFHLNIDLKEAFAVIDMFTASKNEFRNIEKDGFSFGTEFSETYYIGKFAIDYFSSTYWETDNAKYNMDFSSVYTPIGRIGNYLSSTVHLLLRNYVEKIKDPHRDILKQFREILDYDICDNDLKVLAYWCDYKTEVIKRFIDESKKLSPGRNNISIVEQILELYRSDIRTNKHEHYEKNKDSLIDEICCLYRMKVSNDRKEMLKEASMEGVGEDSQKEEAHINAIGLMLIDHIDHLYKTDLSMVAGDEDKMSEMVMSSCH